MLPLPDFLTSTLPERPTGNQKNQREERERNWTAGHHVITTGRGIWLWAEGSAGLRVGLAYWGRGNWKLGGGACAPATIRVLPAIESECLVITVPPFVRRGTTESLGCRARVAARSSGSREWKQRTRAGKAGAEHHPSPRAPRRGTGRERARAHTRTHTRTHAGVP